MSAPTAAASAALRLHARRCVRHPSREAAARCPGCAEFFCRECVVEHAGKLLCAACLARITVAETRRRQRLAGARRTAWSAAGAVVLWCAFYLLGALLVKIPSDFHDGTFWRDVAEWGTP